MTLEIVHAGNAPKEWAALYAVGALTPEEKISYEQHLQGECAICKSELAKFTSVAAQLALETLEVPPTSLKARLIARIEQEANSAINQNAPGVLLQNGVLLISRSIELPWEPAPIPGISSKAIYVDSARKYSTSLVRLESGAVYPSHRHNDIEEVYLLDGDFLVEGVQMRPGDYCRSEPG